MHSLHPEPYKAALTSSFSGRFLPPIINQLSQQQLSRTNNNLLHSQLPFPSTRSPNPINQPSLPTTRNPSRYISTPTPTAKMQCTIMTATALAGILAFVSGVNASPVQAQAPAVAVEDRTAWMFKYCTETGLGGKCAQKADDGNLSVCEDLSALGGEPAKSIQTYSNFDCWTYANANCGGLATRYIPGTYNNPSSFKTWRCYAGSSRDHASA
ncbi:hypothetical protein PG985_007713 [Apiospora marii]|uniref:uncharacterized protein n=1 Tax=Apiospora marii TaxID=335849 RepID=UPI00312D7AA5